MSKYLIKRLLRGALSVIAVVAIVMVMIYSLMNRQSIFAADANYSKQNNNQKTVYMQQQWEKYGYLDYVSYADWMQEQFKAGEIDQATLEGAVKLGRSEDKDLPITKKYTKLFKEYYESQGYEVVRLKAVASGTKVLSGGQPQLFASRDIPFLKRFFSYFGRLISVDNIHYVEKKTKGTVENPGLTFTLHDPLAGGKFSPAIIGNGTRHKYLLYFDSSFPYIHQNLVTLNLGTSYSVNTGVDVFETMNKSQGSTVLSTVTYPTGRVEQSADDLHTATYIAGSRDNALYKTLFTDDYTNTVTNKSGKSKIGYSFIIGIFSVLMAYLLAIPLGILMALKKDKLVDKIGTVYIVFIIAVPSLAYIFLFKTIGGSVGLPTTFDMDNPSALKYLLPIISLALPSIANLMKWLRRYMIDQMNSDYVKFARSGGLSEGEIFSKHILKNAAIPIIHGIPGSVLGALTGAIITERVYVVPGAGNLLTEAINKYDNIVIVGVTLFYAVLSVVSIILGDILMSMVDPRISFNTKAR